MQKSKLRNGQALVESIVAVSILVAGFLGMFALLNKSLSLNRVISDNYTGTYLAAEGIEIIKNIIDTNFIIKDQNDDWRWNEIIMCPGASVACAYEVDYLTCSDLEYSRCPPPRLLSGSPSPLRFNAANNLYGYDSGAPTSFTRRVRVSFFNAGADLDGPPDAVSVNSIVEWRSGAGFRSVNLEDIFYNWKP